ncbi:MAG: sterol desaturase family protein [Rhodospirillales bacterium]|nr:sterol desaturase family protein [Rhodospirillales bacterium]MBT4039813.1 sterol desaturase family protein [Rhodospirillales bacterium]MBT4627555.1 sterol desaturase family protein [Rhodospirillales bacterium]MBT5350573.1 sterol desaturase family protein [Rhodospirillales bacterium]MBT5520301.1 sterol desaturase family protein [Rhodospirillales bacterium]
MNSNQPSEMARQWHYRPDVPIQVSPLLSWPLSPRRIAEWIAKRWLRLAENSILVVVATLTWFYFQPPLDVTKTLAFDWVAAMYIRNLIMIVAVAGGLHLYFYRFRRQGDFRLFDSRPLKTKSRVFTFNDQVLDNVFWSVASGVTFWTAYEVLMLWAMANGYVPVLRWDDNPLWFGALLFLTPIWISFHFYWVHLWLHWPPAYRLAHALHHRNINVGPWSGLSMHPLEHLIFFSSILIHGVIAAHPIHILFHMQHQALTAATSHTGFENLNIGNKSWLGLGTFHHQMHHRYFECNYGNLEMPIDKWAGSFHDGTDQSHEVMKERRRQMMSGS